MLGLAALFSASCFGHSPERDLSGPMRCPERRITAIRVWGNQWVATCSSDERVASYTCTYGKSTSYVGFCKMDGYSETHSTDTVVDSIPYKAGTDLEFHPNGQLEVGTLAADVTLGGITYKAGTELHFRDNGKFIGVKNADGTCCSLVTAHTQ